MDREAFKKQAQIFKNARGNLLLVVILTLVNIIMIAAESDFSFLFSATLPQIAMVYTALAAWSMVAGFFVGLICIGVYFLFWALSKKYRVFILIALILFSIDMLFFFLFIVSVNEFDFASIIHFAFMCWVLCCLIVGTKAWAILRRIHPHEVDMLFAEIGDKNAQNSATPPQYYQQPPPYQQYPQQQQPQQYQQQPYQQYPQQLPPQQPYQQYPQQPYQQYPQQQPPQQYYQQPPPYQYPQQQPPAPPYNQPSGAEELPPQQPPE
jgi:hypothetical protein